MTDKKISQLTSLVTIDPTDIIPVVDMLAVPIQTKKILVSDFLATVPLKSNNLSDLPSPKIARVNLKIDIKTAVADTNYSVLPNDKAVVYTSLTAPRVITLPLSSSINDGKELIFADESGNCSNTNTITIQAQGSDTVNGASSITIASPYAMRAFLNDAVNGKYTCDGGSLRVSKNLSDVQSASVSRTNLGLGNVDNTSDASKPVSTAQQTALDLKTPYVDIQTFSSSGTWTKPTNGVPKLIRVIGIGAGGGGGSGPFLASATSGSGGGGGGGGSLTEMTFDPSAFAATAAVTIGSGVGTGGAAVTSLGPGAAGTAGGSTIFSASTTFLASGGGGGAGGSAGTIGAGGGGGSNRATGGNASGATAGSSSYAIGGTGTGTTSSAAFCGSGGGGCSALGVSGTSGASINSPSGGGAGGGFGAGATIGLTGGPALGTWSTTDNGASGAAPGGTGGAGGVRPTGYRGGTGGGGGGSSINGDGTSGIGGPGGVATRGGGGGGGGAGQSRGGAGADGANGMLWVITYF